MQIDLFEIFNLGVDYGQLTMEQERENEEWADAFNCYIYDSKCQMSANELPRRQLHSEKWFNAKEKSYKKFMDILKETNGGKLNYEVQK